MGDQKQQPQMSLVDRLIDSQLEWRQLIKEANAPHEWRLERELSEPQIKRQELIHELVQTERHHCLTLALMRQVYLSGLRRLNEERSQQQQQHQQDQQQQQPVDLIDLERLFPALEELVQAHELFFAHLRLRLVEACRRPPPVGLVGPLGELLRDQFRLTAPVSPHPVDDSKNGQQQAAGNGQKLLRAYAKFCGHHYDSSRYYKHLMQADKQFKQFIEQCNKQNASCRRRGIPECNLLVAQRLTKYPLLIEQLIKTSKGEPNDEEQQLRLALGECKSLLGELNNQLARKESFERLLDIYAHFSPKSHTTYNRQARFTKHHLLQHKRLRQLLHSDSQLRLWSAQRRKLCQVLCLILNDIVVFLRIEAATSTSGESAPPPSASTSADPQQLDYSSADWSSASQQQTDSHQLPLGGQCALLNAVAGAYHHYHHSLGASPLHSLGPLLLGNSPQQHQHLATSTSRPTSHDSLLSSQNQQQHQLEQNGYSVKYYFANIDNKSSVISLSKLLVREKAAGGDQEPRVYLISSSQRQPEMYELAFVSRRHQTSFVDKLKASIERHNRRRAEVGASDEEEEEEEEEDCHLLSRMAATECACSLSVADNKDDVDEASSQEEEDNQDADEEVESDASDDDERDRSWEQQQQRQQTTSDGDETFCTVRTHLEPFELLIEQDVVLPPPGSCEDDASSSSSPPASGERQLEDEEGDEDDDKEASHESGLSERAKDSLDEASSAANSTDTAARHKLRGGRRRRQQRPRNVSNQSSSSSEAAHRQAIQLIAAKPIATQKPPGYETEEFDSGRGHDDSSSSVSTNSLTSQSQKTPLAPVSPSASSSQSPGGGSQPEVAKQQPPPLTPASSPPPSQRRDSDATPTLIKCASSAGCCATSHGAKVGSKSSGSSSCNSTPTTTGCCHHHHQLKQHRKLSTVSTMSSQLKLISKLKLGLAEQQQQIESRRCCCCHHSDATGSRQARQQVRRSTFIPEQKLEELRDLRIQLDKDKQEWQAKFNRMQEQLLDERRELDLAREKLKRDQQQVANEREQLYRKLDVLKEKGILLSPSHKVIITTPELRHSSHQFHSPQQQHYHHHQHLNHLNHLTNQSTTSSIQIQGQQRQQQHHHQFQPLGCMTTNNFNHVQQHQQHLQEQQFLRTGSSSLLIQNGKVPLHLSENGGHHQHQQQQQQLKLSSLGLSKVPLVGSPSNSLLAQRLV